MAQWRGHYRGHAVETPISDGLKARIEVQVGRVEGVEVQNLAGQILLHLKEQPAPFQRKVFALLLAACSLLEAAIWGEKHGLRGDF